MTCHCGKPALTQVGDKGFCKLHREEAVAATVKAGKKSLGKGASFGFVYPAPVTRKTIPNPRFITDRQRSAGMGSRNAE